MDAIYDDWDKYFEILDIDEIKKEFLNDGLAGCFWLYDDGGDAQIEKADIPDWESVLKMLEQVVAIGREKNPLREFIIGIEPAPENNDPNKVYQQMFIQAKECSLKKMIETAQRMMPDRIIIKDADKYPDFLAAYVYMRDMTAKGVFKDGYYDINFSLLNKDYDRSPISHNCFVRPAPAPFGGFVVYENTDINKVRMIAFSDYTEEECYKILEEIENLQAKYRDHCFKVEKLLEQDKDYYKNKCTKIIRDVVKNICNEDGMLSVCWNQYDELTGSDILACLDPATNYNDGSYGEIRARIKEGEPLGDILNDYLKIQLDDSHVDVMENDLLEAVDYRIRKTDNQELIDFWESELHYEKMNHLYSAGYNGVDLNPDDLLEKTVLRVNVLLSTPQERNYDNTTIIDCFGNNWKDPTDV